MVQARFINDTTTVEITSETDVKRVQVNRELNHDLLTGRELSDQHPISAITGLQAALDRADTYIHEQGVASDTWVITHNLGKYPSVTVVDSAGEAQIPDNIDYNSDNQLTIQFIGSFAGKAFLN